MKSNHKVLHVTLSASSTIHGVPIQRMVFDSKESVPGIQMNLSPLGVECRAPKFGYFLLPFHICGPIVLAPEEKPFAVSEAAAKFVAASTKTDGAR